MEKRPVAYQIYSAREEAREDLAKVFKALKAMGYDGVELAGFYDYTAQEIRSMLDDCGLRAPSSHVPLPLIEQDMFGVISDHLALGCEYIAVPYLPEENRPGRAGFPGTLRTIYSFARLCQEAGIELLYHNHDFEFVTFCGMYALDFLYEAMPERLLKTELDTCWVKYAGEDPAAYIRKYAGRCPVIHLKDFVGDKGNLPPYALVGLNERERKAASNFEYRPVGHGCQDVRALLNAGIESGAKWFVVEQDESLKRAPLEAARMSIDTLIAEGLK